MAKADETGRETRRQAVRSREAGFLDGNCLGGPAKQDSVLAVAARTRRVTEAPALAQSPLGRETTAHLVATVFHAAFEDSVSALPAIRPVVASLTALGETALGRFMPQGAAALGIAASLEATLDDSANTRLAGLTAGVRGRTARATAAFEAVMQELLSPRLADPGFVSRLDALAEGVTSTVATARGTGCRRVTFV